MKTKWYPEVKHFRPNTPIILVGTKLDLVADRHTIETLRGKKQAPISNQQGETLRRNINAVKYIGN